MNKYDEEYQLDLGKRNGLLLMIMRPTNFQPSEFSKQDNHFMKNFELTLEQVKEGAIKEHQSLEKCLHDNKIAYKCFEQTNPEAHDSCFLSDCIMAIKNEDFPRGLLVISPMYWPNRRLEKYPHIYEWLKTQCEYQHVVDLSHFEKENKALEGKGVTLFDWEARTIYVGESNRAHRDVVAALAEKMTEISGKKYDYFLVQNYDKFYKQTHFHTSVYMMIYKKTAVVCSDVLTSQEHFEEIKKRLEASGKEVLDCCYKDMENGATLGIEFFREDGSNGLLLSDFCSTVSESTKEFFARHFKEMIYLEAPILVDVGGSSVECLIQTVPLLKNKNIN